MTTNDWVWWGFRFFDCFGALCVAVMFWANTKRRAAAGKLDVETVQLRLSMLTYFIGTGLLFGRALVIGSPGGPHLVLIAAPIGATLWALAQSERNYRRNRND